MTIKRYLAVSVLLYAGLLAVLFTPGCLDVFKSGKARAALMEAETNLAETVAENERLQTELSEIDITDPNAKDTAEELIALIREGTESVKTWSGVINEAKEAITEEEAGLDWAELGLSALAGFFPPAGAGVTMIRRGRRAFNAAADEHAGAILKEHAAFDGIVASVAAGGGPANGEAVRAAMKHYPGLKDRVTASRVAIGDKVMEAVKSTA